MIKEWEGIGYAICPKCKQVVRKEELENGTHICKPIFPGVTTGIWD